MRGARRAQDRQLVTALARRAVADAAPDEAAQFELTAEAYFAAPRRARRAAKRDEPLGLGLESVSVLVGTAALSVAVEVVKHLATHYSEKFTSRVARRVRALLGRRRAAPRPSLDREQLRHLHELARRKAVDLQVPEHQATLIADGIVAELALSAPASTVDE